MMSGEPNIVKVEIEMGRDRDCAVPVVDAETMALIQEIRRKELLLAEVDMKLEHNKDQKMMTAEAMKGLDRELRNTEAQIKVKEREGEFHNHFAALAENKIGVLSKRVTRMQEEQISYGERKKHLEDRILQTKQKLVKFQKQMNWDQQTMENFLKQSERRNDDAMAIVKYAQKDDKKVKTLNLAIEKMAVEVSDKRKEVDKWLTENRCLQLALDKAADDLQKTYQETRQLNQLWEDVVKQRQARDAEMQRCATKLTRANAKHREKSAVLADLTQMFNNQKKNNRELERKIDKSKYEVLKLQRNLVEEEKNFRILHDEAGFCQVELRKVAADVSSLTTDVLKKRREIRDNNEKLAEQDAYNAALREKLEAVTRTAITEEAKAAHMDQLLMEEQKMVKELEVLLLNNGQERLLATQHLEALKAKEKDLIMQVSKTKLTLREDCKRQENLELRLQKQETIIVEQVSYIDLLKAKLAVLEGKNMSAKERQKLEAKLSQETENLEETKATANLLRNALKESEHALRRLKKEFDKSEAQKGDLSSTVEQLMLRCSGQENNLATLRVKKEECLVRRQILKVEVERLSNLLNNKEDSMLSSQKRKLKLQKAIREREDELRIQRDVLRRHATLIDQERQKLSMQVSEKLRKIDLLKKRFEAMVATMSVPAEEEESAQVYIITKATVEYEKLRRKSDALDAQIRKTELENVALENSNMLFDDHNAHQRKALNRGDESNPELQEKLRLEEELKAVQAKLRNKTKQVKELQKDLQDKIDTLETFQQREQAATEEIDGKRLPISKLRKEITSQQDKIGRAAKQCSQLIKQIRSANNTKAETLAEKDIMVKELREFSRTFDRMLSEVMAEHPDLKMALERHLQQAGVSFPATPPPPPSALNSQRSSKTGSFAPFRSTTSSARSTSKSTASSAAVSHLQMSRTSKPPKQQRK